MREGQEPSFTMPVRFAELQAALEETWPARSAALRASGVPLNEETEEEKAAREKKEADDAAAAKKKPWGDDADFDPDKAWKLIENLRADAAKLKTSNDAQATKIKGFEDASKSDEEKREERATSAEQKADALEREAARLRIAMRKGLTETQAKRLVGDNEEELEKDADDLLASFKDDDGDGGDGDDGTRRTPKPRLRTGAAPSSEPDETDPAKLAEQVPRRFR